MGDFDNLPPAVRVNPGDNSYGTVNWPSGGGGSSSGSASSRGQTNNRRQFSATTTGGGNGTNGLYPSGWTTPVDDPGAATRNYLRSIGQLGNPFNQSWQRAINTFSAGLPAHYASYAYGGGVDPSKSFNEGFGQFIQERANGTRGPMGMGQAATSLAELSRGLQTLAGSMPQGHDMSTPEGRAAAIAAMQASGGMGGLNVGQVGILGQFLTPQDQAALFLSAYLPMLGPGLASGLQKVMAPRQQAWDDYLGAVQGPTNKSFLDMLLGSL